MSTPVAIDAAAWKAARPALRRIRWQAMAAAALVAAAVAELWRDSPGWRGLLAGALGTGTWILAHYTLAALAVHKVRPAVRHLPLWAVTKLISEGTAQVEGSTWIAVEDEHAVTLTTAPGAGRGPELPLSVITNLGNSGGS